MGGVLVVTGGSRGIGAAVCRLGAERGYAVAVNYVGQQKRADEVAGAIRAGGGTAIAVAAPTSPAKVTSSGCSPRSTASWAGSPPS